MFIILINRILFCIHGFYEALNFIPYLLLCVEGKKNKKTLLLNFQPSLQNIFF